MGNNVANNSKFAEGRKKKQKHTGWHEERIKFASRRVSGQHDEHPTRAVEQEVLQREWNDLGFEEKAVRRAQRARRGERCAECGCVGYFRRNCPTCPPVRFDVQTGGWRKPTIEELRCERQKHVDRTEASINAAAMYHESIGDSSRAPDVPGQGFLWGKLAVESTRNGKENAAPTQASSMASPSGSALLVEMPSLAGSSNLSSGIISGLRKALMWADEGVAVPWSGSIVSSLDGMTVSGTKYPAGNEMIPATGHRSCSEQDRAPTVFGSKLGSDHAARECGRQRGSQRDIIHTPSHKDSTSSSRNQTNPQDFTWRWPEFCSSIADITPATPGQGHMRSENCRNEHLTSQPPRDSYLQLRNNAVLTVQDNLHLALQRLATAVRGQAGVVTSESFVDGLLQGPRGGRPPEHYCRPSTQKDFREIFDAEEEEAARRRQPKAHAYLGGLREVGSLKYAFDRTSHSRTCSLATHLRGDFEPKPDGYRGRSVHSLVEWRRPNTTLDRYASSGRDAIERVASSERALRRQSNWVMHQKLAREHRRGRANQLLEVFRTELLQEQMREIEVLRLPRREQHLHVAAAMRDRVTAADRIMRTIRDYGLMSNTEDAHYIMYALDAARRAGLADNHRTPPSQEGQQARAASSHTIVNHMVSPRDVHPERKQLTLTFSAAPSEVPLGAGMSLPEKEEVLATPAQSVTREAKSASVQAKAGPQPAAGHCVAVVDAREARKAVGERRENREVGRGTHELTKGRQTGVDEDDGDELSPYSSPMTRPAKLAVRLKPGKTVGRRRESVSGVRDGVVTSSMAKESSAAAKEAKRRQAKGELMRTFNLAGHPVRRGVDNDTTTGSSAGDEKSFVAGRIMGALRAGEVDPITGRQAEINPEGISSHKRKTSLMKIFPPALKSAVPLWHRTTEEIDSSDAGSVLYSDLIGHTYSVLTGPRRGGLVVPENSKHKR